MKEYRLYSIGMLGQGKVHYVYLIMACEYYTLQKQHLSWYG